MFLPVWREYAGMPRCRLECDSLLCSVPKPVNKVYNFFKIYPDYCEPASDKPFSPSVGCRFDLSGFLVSFTFSIKVQDYAKLQLVDENGGAVLRLLAESGQWSRGLRKHT